MRGTKSHTVGTRRPIIDSPFNADIHMTLAEATKATDYGENYLIGDGAVRYGLTRFTDGKLPVFFLKSEIEKLVSTMTQAAAGKNVRLNGHRPRIARFSQHRTRPYNRPTNRTNGVPSLPNNGNGQQSGEITVVGSVDTIRDLLTKGFNIRFEVKE